MGGLVLRSLRLVLELFDELLGLGFDARQRSMLEPALAHLVEE